VSDDRVAALLAHLEVPRRDDVSAITDLSAVLDSQLAAIAEALPTLTISDALYLTHLAHRVAQRATESADRVIRTMHAADLYLAAACAEGDAAAIAVFEATLVPPLRRALGKLSPASTVLDEAVQRVVIMVLVGDGKPPQIAGYSGRGTLTSWLRTIAVRTARRMLGTEQSHATTDDDEIAELPSAVRDPELELLRVRYRDSVRAAFAAAFAGLETRERNVLRQYHIDGLTIDQLAALYRVNRATTARWVAGARLAVVKATREQLVSTAGVPAHEVDSVIRLVRSQLELSVRDLAV
jgi:RNA polymerase sigma-70 factor (ECF subfamily)